MSRPRDQLCHFFSPCCVRTVSKDPSRDQRYYAVCANDGVSLVTTCAYRHSIYSLDISSRLESSQIRGHRLQQTCSKCGEYRLGFCRALGSVLPSLINFHRISLIQRSMCLNITFEHRRNIAHDWIRTSALQLWWASIA